MSVTLAESPRLGEQEALCDTEISVVMPCLNEAHTVGRCVDKAREALRRAEIKGEVIVADNGSTDGSPEIARAHGAWVVQVERRGYGSALQAGIAAAHGRFVIMGDADDSYDFSHIEPFLQAREARPWIPSGAKVLDIGCHEGEFLRSLRGRIGPSVGIDPLAKPTEGSNYQILARFFTEPAPFPDASFDSIVLLATLKHIRDKEPLGRECHRLLRPGGRVIITVPSPFVDHIVYFLCRMNLADGMSLDEHHGFDPSTTAYIVDHHGFALEYRRKFQIGLNHLYAFRKQTTASLVGSGHEAVLFCA